MTATLLTQVPVTAGTVLALTDAERGQLAAAFTTHHAAHRRDQVRAAWRVVQALALTGDDTAVQNARAELWCAVLPQAGRAVATAAADALLVELAGHLMTDAERILFAGPWWTIHPSAPGGTDG